MRPLFIYFTRIAAACQQGEQQDPNKPTPADGNEYCEVGQCNLQLKRSCQRGASNTDTQYLGVPRKLDVVCVINISERDWTQPGETLEGGRESTRACGMETK